MGLENYRVRKNFQWDGWIYAPQGPDGVCKCGCGAGRDCTGVVATDCGCHDTACHCDCGIRSHLYGGDVWFVDEGNPRKEMMLNRRYATYDSSLAPSQSMLEQSEYKKLLSPPTAVKSTRKRIEAAAQ
jgi:hypothetical protein